MFKHKQLVLMSKFCKILHWYESLRGNFCGVQNFHIFRYVRYKLQLSDHSLLHNMNLNIIWYALLAISYNYSPIKHALDFNTDLN